MNYYKAPDDCRYHYEIEGSGPPLLMLHGIIQGIAEWRRAGWIDALSDIRTLVILDMPGHGHSDRPAEHHSYRIETIAAGVIGLMASLGHPRFDLFGFSLGGRVGFEILARNADHLNSAVISGQHARPPRLEQRLSGLVGAFRGGRLRAMERGMGIRAAPGADGGCTTMNDPEAVATAIEALRMWDGAESALAGIRTPVLLIAGSKDPAFDAAQDSASQIPSARFETLDGVNHSGSFYDPNASLTKIREFLKSPE